ncbi:STAS domain-containing protein [Alloacidobacterium dinghuense]|uniref:Anti-sigma factor antagonist n=1 Tax=Alloacidobacterium dinghuense TaxID=2763107 RepID=A0A7G8BD30_9BACT|nr:STAS domain-containing protein [Alloacidobacterium dinghuense]QNI30450.1 STAS domain-containing protein [Alloacidobacterium dinghuense]
MGEIVSISGRVAIDTSSRMRDRLADALRSKPDALTIDLTQVDYMDTSGLATLIEAMRLARQQNTELLLRGVQEQPRYLLRVSDLDRVFPIEEDAKP